MADLDYTVTINSTLDRGWSQTVNSTDTLPPVAPAYIIATPLVFNWAYEDGLYPGHWEPATAQFSMICDTVATLESLAQLGDRVRLTITIESTPVVDILTRITSLKYATIHKRNRPDYGDYRIRAEIGLADIVSDLASETIGISEYEAENRTYDWRLGQVAVDLGMRLTQPTSVGDGSGYVAISTTLPDGNALEVTRALAVPIGSGKPCTVMSNPGNTPIAGHVHAGRFHPGSAWPNTPPAAHGCTYPLVLLPRPTAAATARLVGSSPAITYESAPLPPVGPAGTWLTSCAVVAPIGAEASRRHAVTRLRIQAWRAESADGSVPPPGEFFKRTYGRNVLPGRPPVARQIAADQVGRIRATSGSGSWHANDQLARAQLGLIVGAWSPDEASRGAAWAPTDITITSKTLTNAYSPAVAAQIIAAITPTPTSPITYLAIGDAEGMIPSGSISGWPVNGTLRIDRGGEITYQITCAPGIPSPGADSITWDEFNTPANPYRLTLPTDYAPTFRIYEWVWIADPEDW